jgi:hypothetical protein
MRMTPIKIGPAGKIGKAFAPTGAPPDFSGWAFFFGVTRGEQPLVRASRPCRAEHAAFASQTGRRLKSPAGAFMASPPPSFSSAAFLVLFWHAKENISGLFVASYSAP